MRFLGRLLVLTALMLLGGFFVFVASLPRADHFDIRQAYTKLDTIPQTEIGIVVLTGGGGARIERALSLYREKIADRVLISGTHPDVRKIDLAERFDPELLECCVELGMRAQTTIGNGIETRDWVNANQYKGIFLVTHDYHLPRAMMEVQSMAPNIVVVGVPVASTPIKNNWYQSREGWNLLAREYGKYLLAAIRTVL